MAAASSSSRPLNVIQPGPCPGKVLVLVVKVLVVVVKVMVDGPVVTVVVVMVLVVIFFVVATGCVSGACVSGACGSGACGSGACGSDELLLAAVTIVVLADSRDERLWLLMYGVEREKGFPSSVHATGIVVLLPLKRSSPGRALKMSA